VEPLGGIAPLTVKCTDKSTGNPSMYNYDFGDGVNMTGPNPSHTYRFPGNYTIKQKVMKYDKTSNSFLTSSTKSQPVTVSAVPFVPPVAKFIANPVNGTVPMNVTFSDRSSGNPTSYMYDFGDGINTTGPNPVHSYRDPGNYTVTLTVMKNDPVNGTMVNNVTVYKDLITVGGK
jgi:PKD repeat protein